MGIDPGRVTAVIVTRGDVPLTPILKSLIFDNVVVWDNSKREVDAAAYGRFLAMHDADTEIVLSLDDDVHLPEETQFALCDQYVDGVLLSNMEPHRHGQGWAWWGWGAICQRELPELAFRYWHGDRGDLGFLKTGCDILAGTLIPHRLVSLPHTHADYAHGPDRLYQDPRYPEWRSSYAKAARLLAPMPLKLNLGCGTQRLPGFVNLDPLTGWRFEDGLPYDDASVAAISVSHSLMFVPLDDWPAAFAEMARVLEPYGVIRITEDATDDRRSERYGGHPDAVTLTSARLVLAHLREAGMTAREPNLGATGWVDASLMQDWHGGYPKCFFVEGVRG